MHPPSGYYRAASPATPSSSPSCSTGSATPGRRTHPPKLHPPAPAVIERDVRHCTWAPATPTRTVQGQPAGRPAARAVESIGNAALVGAAATTATVHTTAASRGRRSSTASSRGPRRTGSTTVSAATPPPSSRRRASHPGHRPPRRRVGCPAATPTPPRIAPARRQRADQAWPVRSRASQSPARVKAVSVVAAVTCTSWASARG